MNVFNAYKYLYYRIYSWNLQTWGKSDVPHFNALLGLTFLVFLNIYALLMIVELLTEYSFFNFLGFGIWNAVIIYWAAGVINYFIFLYKGKYKKIAKDFVKESNIKKNKRFVWCLVYTAFSFSIAFIALILSIPS